MKTQHTGIHVFSGPTLSHNEGLSLRPDAHFHAPIQCGDLMRLMSQAPNIIVIIDGIYENKPSIWHKEILTAIHQGVTVIGCSSMGALRATELSQHGMIGHGKIYQQYQDGTLTDDDEVAVAHYDHSLDYAARNEALINIRFTLQKAIDSRLLTNHQAHTLITILKQTFYWKRTIQHALIHSDLPTTTKDQLLQWWPSHWIDQKKQDAKDTLIHLSTVHTQASIRSPQTTITIQSLNLFKQHAINHNTASLTGILEKHITYCLMTIKHVTPDLTPHPLFKHYLNWLNNPHDMPDRAILEDLIAHKEHDIKTTNAILSLYHYPQELQIDNDNEHIYVTQCLRQQLWRVILNSYALARWKLNPAYLEQYITQYRQLKQLQTATDLQHCLRTINLTMPDWEDIMMQLARYKYLITDSRLCYFELTKDHFKSNWSDITHSIIQSCIDSIK